MAADLESFFGLFGTIRCLNAEISQDDLFEQLEAMLGEIYNQKEMKNHPSEAPQDASDQGNLENSTDEAEKSDCEKKESSELTDDQTNALEGENSEDSKQVGESQETEEKETDEKIEKEPISLEQELALLLAEQIDTVQISHGDALKQTFRALREHRNAFSKRMYNLREEFLARLQLPDRRQEIMDEFEKEFNAVENDMRYLVETKEVGSLLNIIKAFFFFL